MRPIFLLFLFAGGCGESTTSTGTTRAESTVSVHVFDDNGELVGPDPSPRVVKSPAQWRDILSPEEYEVTRHHGTERPFSGKHLRRKTDGVYVCRCCSLPLFDSQSKYDSGTGWPSFFEPIAKTNVGELADHSLGMERTEVVCIRCDAHLGHVFPGGPQPTGLRYCINSVALAFRTRPLR